MGPLEFTKPGCVGRGSGWDLRVRPAPPAVSGNMGHVKKYGTKFLKIFFPMYPLVEDMSKIQISGKMDAQPSGSGRLDAKRHYVILAKALDGIWPVGHACAVLC